MSVLLAVDTAGPVIGVALSVSGRVTERYERVRRGSETRLAVWCAELARQADVSLDQLDAVVVAEGPGAFTGLRVGLAMALGVAHAARCPVVPVSSLTSRAVAAKAPRVLAMLDARKGRVYAQWSTDGGHTVGAGPGDVPPEDALQWATAPFVATGEGAVVFSEAVVASGGTVAPGADNPGLPALLRLGQHGLDAGHAVAPSAVRPVYLRRPDARTIAERAAARQQG